MDCKADGSVAEIATFAHAKCDPLLIDEQIESGERPHCVGLEVIDTVQPFPDSLVCWHVSATTADILTTGSYTDDYSLTEFAPNSDGAALLLQQAYQQYQILESKIVLTFYLQDNVQYRVQFGPRQAGATPFSVSAAERAAHWKGVAMSRYLPGTRTSSSISMSDIAGYNVVDNAGYIVDPPATAAKMYVWQVRITNVNGDLDADPFHFSVKIYYKTKWTRPIFDYSDLAAPARDRVCYIDQWRVTPEELKHFRRLKEEEREAALEALELSSGVGVSALREPSVSAMSAVSAPSTRSLLKK